MTSCLAGNRPLTAHCWPFDCNEAWERGWCVFRFQSLRCEAISAVIANGAISANLPESSTSPRGHRIDTQPEVRLPWKLVPFFLSACPKYAINTPFWRHIDAIQPPSWQVSPALLPFRRHLPATKADVLLTFCTCKVLYANKPGGKNYRGNLPGGVLMATIRCARRYALGH